MLLRKKAVKLAIYPTARSSRAANRILCLCMFVFTDIVSGSLLVAFSPIAGASTGILMVLYFDARKG
jgi:hypothetical protein